MKKTWFNFGSDSIFWSCNYWNCYTWIKEWLGLLVFLKDVGLEKLTPSMPNAQTLMSLYYALCTKVNGYWLQTILTYHTASAKDKLNISYWPKTLPSPTCTIYGTLPQAAKQVLTAYHYIICHAHSSYILFLVLSVNLYLSCTFMSSKQYSDIYTYCSAFVVRLHILLCLPLKNSA